MFLFELLTQDTKMDPTMDFCNLYDICLLFIQTCRIQKSFQKLKNYFLSIVFLNTYTYLEKSQSI